MAAEVKEVTKEATKGETREAEGEEHKSTEVALVEETKEEALVAVDSAASVTIAVALVEETKVDSAEAIKEEASVVEALVVVEEALAEETAEATVAEEEAIRVETREALIPTNRETSRGTNRGTSRGTIPLLW